MKNSRRNMMAGLGLGAGLLAIAGAGAGLAMAYKKAKEQDKTIRSLVSEKINSVKSKACSKCGKKHTCICDEYSNDNEFDDAFVGYDEDILDSDDFDYDSKDLFDITEDEDVVEETIDDVKASRDYYKTEYEKLARALIEVSEREEQ